MPAMEAVLMLDEVLRNDEIEAFKHTQSNYYSSLPLYQNAEKLPDPPEIPEWLLQNDEED